MALSIKLRVLFILGQQQFHIIQRPLHLYVLGIIHDYVTTRNNINPIREEYGLMRKNNCGVKKEGRMNNQKSYVYMIKYYRAVKLTHLEQ